MNNSIDTKINTIIYNKNGDDDDYPDDSGIDDSTSWC